MTVKKMYFSPKIIKLSFYMFLLYAPHAQSQVQTIPTPALPQNIENNNYTEAKLPFEMNITDGELLQQPQLLNQILNELVDTNNWLAIERYLNLYRQTPNPDAILIEFAQAGLERYNGQYPQAIKRYETLAQKYPDLPRVRLDLAATLVENNQEISAIKQLDSVRNEHPPSNVLNNIDMFTKQINTNPKYNVQLNSTIGVVWDSNINNSSTDKTLTLGPYVFQRDADSLPQSGYGLTYSAELSKRQRIADFQSFNAEIKLMGKDYPNFHRFDEQNMYFGIGYQWQNARHTFNLMPAYQKKRLANTAYSNSQTMRAEWLYLITPKWQSAVTYEYNRRRYVTSKFLDGHDTFASIFLSYQLGNKTQLFGGVDVLKSNTDEPSESSLRTGYRLGLVQQLPQGLAMRVQLGYANRAFKDAPNLFGIHRHDREIEGSLMLWHNRLQIWGIAPRLLLTYNKVLSNTPLYDYQKKQVSILMERKF